MPKFQLNHKIDPKKILKVMIPIVAVAALGGGGYYAYQKFFKKPAEPTAGPAMNMDNMFARVERSDIKEIVSATGVVELQDEQAVYATSKTRVKDVAVEVGDVVEMGQVLVTYDVETTRNDLIKQINQAEITLNNNKLSLESLTLPSSQSDINQLRNNIDSAVRSVADAKATLAGTEASIERQKNEIVLAENSVVRAEENIVRADENIQKAEQDIVKAEQDIVKAEQDIVKAEENILKADRDIEKTEQEIRTSKILLDAGAITQEEHNKVVDTRESAEKAKDSVVDARDSTIDARDSKIDARDSKIDARDNAIDARKDAVDARDNAIESVSKAKNTLEDLIRQKEANQRSIESAQKSVELAESKLADALKDQQISAESDNINYEKQKNQVNSSALTLEDLKKELAEIEDVTTSPLSGTVTEVSVDKGSTVDVDTALIKVANLKQLIASSNISEYDAPNIAIGQEVEMTSDGIPDTVYYGKIITISNEATTQNAVSGTETVVPIEVSIDNPDDKIKTGFNLDLEIVTVDKPDVLGVASSAIVNDYKSGTKYTFTVDGDRNLKKVEVETGVVSATLTEIISGLAEGDRVISSPTDTMEDGMPLMAVMEIMGFGPDGNNGGGRQGPGGTVIMGPGMGGGGSRPAGTTVARPAGGGGR